MNNFSTTAGSAHPLGATPNSFGVNFSVFSEHATNIELLIFEKYSDIEPFQTVNLYHDFQHFWHTFIEGLKPGFFYAYRVDGPFNPEEGLIYNKNKVLIDPYAKGICHYLWDDKKACLTEDNLSSSLRCAVVDNSSYDWEDDVKPNTPLEDTIIYEMHVGNFTKSTTSGVSNPGTFLGVIEKIPYLKSLGITAVELLPVFDFDKSNGKKVENIWGYGSFGFFAPNEGYATKKDGVTALAEFRTMIKALHKSGIEVFLDVAFGHTGERNQTGPFFSFKGFDNSIYYQLDENNKQIYLNRSGCENTLNSNHPIVAKLITDCLEYWTREMHVDGFRLDEASLLSRDENGEIIKYPKALWNIELSEKIGNAKIFVEPWDSAGGYMVGNFPGYRFIEWNGKYRDDVRKFIRGDDGVTPSFALRITGNQDLYQDAGRLPSNSLNFITAHDGFTLYDLVSYNTKHNESNGENNMDGMDQNLSWNCGFEGETTDQSINTLRKKQIKNFIMTLLFSRGIPLITMGDEMGKTQRGNNNPYCHDDEISWLNWNFISKNQEILNFYKGIIELRKNNPVFSKTDFFNDGELVFHSAELLDKDWQSKMNKTFAVTICGKYHLAFNMSDKSIDFQLPPGRWNCLINTARDNNCGIFEKNALINDHCIVLFIKG